MSARAAPPAPGPALLGRLLQPGLMVVTFLVLAVVITAMVEPRFLNPLNINNLLRNFAFLAIPAIAQMLVMKSGGFDLSVGAVVAGSSVITAMTMSAVLQAYPGMEGMAILIALGVAVGAGMAVGLVNGALVAYQDLSPFMVTLAMASVVMGIALYYTQGIPVYGVADSFIAEIGRGRWFGYPPVLFIALGIVALLVVMQRFTRLGRHIYAVGSDLRAARLSGIPARRTLLKVYVMAGGLSALTGFLMTSRIGSGQANIASTLALETIAACVIGGVSLRGGVGRAEHVALAALFLVVVSNAMNLTQIDSRFQTLVLGMVLIIALSIEHLLLRRKLT